MSTVRLLDKLYLVRYIPRLHSPTLHEQIGTGVQLLAVALRTSEFGPYDFVSAHGELAFYTSLAHTVPREELKDLLVAACAYAEGVRGIYPGVWLKVLESLQTAPVGKYGPPGYEWELSE